MKSAFEKTLDVLEWPKFAQFLLENSLSPMGRTFIENFSPETFPRSESSHLSKSIIELVGLHQKQKQLPLTDLVDLLMVYKRMSRGGAIHVEEFAQIIRNQKAV